MGYDMYWVKQPKDAKKAYKEANVVFEKAVEERNKASNELQKKELQNKVEETYDAMYKAQRYYFRLNIWGMGLCRELMEERGMIQSDTGWRTRPAWPEAQEYGLTREELDDALDDWDTRENGFDHPNKKVKKYLTDELKVRRSVPQKVTGIIEYKLCSNDGWIVTPEEIKAALVANNRYEMRHGQEIPLHEGEPVEWWPEWIEWMKKAIEHDGFAVH